MVYENGFVIKASDNCCERKKNTISSEIFSIFPASQVDPFNYKNGIELTLCKTRLAVNSITAGLKTLNRLEQVLAKIELEDTLDPDVKGRPLVASARRVIRRCGRGSGHSRARFDCPHEPNVRAAGSTKSC